MIIITGLQRSGTTALGEMLDAGGCAYFGEVFHPAGYQNEEVAERLMLRPAANFWRFAESDELPKGPQSRKDRINAWYRYANFLVELAGGKTPVIDIKYNSWHNFNAAWQRPSDSPLLLGHALSDPDIRVVHTIRRDQLARIASESIAKRSDLWHQTGGREDNGARFDLSVPHTLERLREGHRQINFMCGWLANDRIPRLIYEDLWSDGATTSGGRRKIKEQTGVNLAVYHKPRIQPLARDPLERIENWEHIKRAAIEAQLDIWPQRKVTA